MSCVCYAFTSAHCCLVVPCWERVDLLALVFDVFVTFPCGILGQVWYLIVSIPDLCRLPYFIMYTFVLFQEKIVSSIETRTVLLFCLIAQLIHLHFSWIIPHL